MLAGVLILCAECCLYLLIPLELDAITDVATKAYVDNCHHALTANKHVKINHSTLAFMCAENASKKKRRKRRIHSWSGLGRRVQFEITI